MRVLIAQPTNKANGKAEPAAAEARLRHVSAAASSAFPVAQFVGAAASRTYNPLRLCVFVSDR